MINVKYWNYVVVVAVLALAILMFFICLPLFHGILLGIGMFYILEPMVRYLSKYMGRNLAAIVAELVFAGVMVAIIGYIGTKFFTEISNFSFSGDLLTSKLDSWGLGYVSDYIARNKDSLTDTFTGYISENIISILSSLIELLIILMVAAFVSYYLLKDKKPIGEFLISFVPLEKKKSTNKLFDNINSTLEGIFFGHVMAAVIIGVVCAIVFNIFALFVDLPYPTILAIITGFMALIPIGPSAITWPVNIYVFYLDFQVGIVFLAFNIILLIVPEYILRPKLAGKHGHVHEMWILFVFLGGPLAFGMGGFILGPLILGVAKAAYDVYIENYKKKEESMLKMGIIEDESLLLSPSTAAPTENPFEESLGAFSLEDLLGRVRKDKKQDVPDKARVEETPREIPPEPLVSTSTATRVTVTGDNPYEPCIEDDSQCFEPSSSTTFPDSIKPASMVAVEAEPGSNEFENPSSSTPPTAAPVDKTRPSKKKKDKTRKQSR